MSESPQKLKEMDSWMKRVGEELVGLQDNYLKSQRAEVGQKGGCK